MIIQLIGLPCSGKTYVLNKIKSKNKSILSLDLSNYKGSFREKRLKKDVTIAQNTNKFIIIESACGLENLNSIVILLRVSKHQLISNQQKRKETNSNYYKSQLIDQMLPPNYTAYDIKSCETLIETILKMESLHVSNTKFNSYSRNH